jgi:hypothetical protein
MFPHIYKTYISHYVNSVSVHDEIEKVITRGTKSDWSFISFLTVVDEDDTTASSEMASLSPLSTDVNDSLLDYLREHVTSIENDANELVHDYALTHDLNEYMGGMYDLLRFSCQTSTKRSVILGDNLQEGLFIEIISLSDSEANVHFPFVDETVTMNMGDSLYFPGGFPFSHRIETSGSNIFLKRILVL